jgi:hypothetical protein
MDASDRNWLNTDPISMLSVCVGLPLFLMCSVFFFATLNTKQDWASEHSQTSSALILVCKRYRTRRRCEEIELEPDEQVIIQNHR